MNKQYAARAISIDTLIANYPEVQLATLTDAVSSGASWVHEIKFDGYRLLGFVSDGDVRLRTRNGKDWTPRFPPLAAALAKLKVVDAVVDMEAVVLDDAGKSSFQALQGALGGGGSASPIIAYVFDLLFLNGEDLTTLPLTDRKEQLEKMLKSGPRQDTLRYSAHVSGKGEAMFAKACETGLEGIICKLADSPYRTGRQKSWLKVKCALRQEFVIVGYSDARTGERAIGALYLAYREKSELKYAGKVGTGFTMKSAAEILARLSKLAVTKPVLDRTATAGLAAGEWRAVHWVKPKLLCEVAFTEWTSDGRVRHPSFQGLREDKDAADVRKETP